MGSQKPTRLDKWPGGIPFSIKITSEVSSRPASRGWYRFVRENWVRGTGTETGNGDEVRAELRRSLILAWVSAEQGVRDELKDFGCYNYTSSNEACYLTTPVSPGSTQHAQWVKLLMFFDYEWERHIANEIFTLCPRENEVITLDSFKRYQALETADSKVIQFNHLGEAVFGPFNPPVILVDERALRTGLVIAVQFWDDGTPAHAYRARPVDLPDAWRRIVGLGSRMDMNLPLLDIVFTYSQETDDPLDKEREEVEEQLNEWAPGYLEAEEEGQGLARDYDLAQVDSVEWSETT